MTDRDLKAEYRALSPSARVYSTEHPHAFYWAAGIECIIITGLGIWVMTETVAGGVLVIALAIAAALITAWPGHWSERHPEQARQAVEIQTERRNRLAKRHPAYFVVFVPVLAGVTAALRYNRDRHHPSTLDWVLPAAIGLVLGLALGIFLIYRAHHSQRDGSSRTQTGVV